jgi:ABC-type multidrug transport system permease subunit
MVPGSPIPAVIAAQMKKIITSFQLRGAVHPDRAVSPESIGVRRNFLFRRLVFRGVLKEVTTDRFYLDAEKLAEFNALRRKKIFVVLGILLVIFLIYAVLYMNVNQN